MEITKIKGNAYLLLEFIILYIGLPLVFYFDLIPVRKIVALLVVTLFCTLLLWMDRSYDFKRLLHRPEGNPVGRELFWKGAGAVVLLLGVVLLVIPENLFLFPRQEPVTWMVVMLLYPFLSALPQELIYREFFFRRYESILPSGRAGVVLSAVAFSFLHIIYDNWWAVGLSLVGGMLLSLTYRQTKSLFWVSVEHALYGCIVFTLGLGGFFYESF